MLWQCITFFGNIGAGILAGMAWAILTMLHWGAISSERGYDDFNPHWLNFLAHAAVGIVGAAFVGYWAYRGMTTAMESYAAFDFETRWIYRRRTREMAQFNKPPKYSP